MYVSRTTKLRDIFIAFINGIITLTILLIAPLGLLAVLINTVLVVLASYFVATYADKVIAWLLPSSQQADLISPDNLPYKRFNRPKILRRGERPPNNEL